MVARHESDDEAGNRAAGFVVECDCCGSRMDRDGVARAADGFEVFYDREHAHEVAEATGWMVDVRGTVVICPDCQTEISRGNIRMNPGNKGGRRRADRVQESLKEGGVE